MSKVPEEKHRACWEARGRSVARQLNFAWWMETLAGPMLVAALVGAAALLLVRREVMAVEWWMIAAGTASVLAGIALACWRIARRRFETPEQALVRIEAAMQLRNALSAARAGVAPWPAPAVTYHSGLKWQWPRLLVPILGALLLWASGIFIPVTARGLADSAPPEQPQAWNRLDSELAHLEKEEAVDEKYLEEMRERLEELRGQEEDQWFSHSSMEATDSLRKAHRSESERLERALDRAESALTALDKKGEAMAAEQRDRLLDQLDHALNGLRNGAMKPNPELLEQLKQLDPNAPLKLDPALREQLSENLRKHAQALREAAEAGGDDWLNEPSDGECPHGDCEGGEGEGGKCPSCDGKGKGSGKQSGDSDNNGTGDGGINEGGGHSPDVLGRQRERLDADDLLQLESRDLSRALPGDLLELENAEHDLDDSATRLTAGGGIGATGSGGDRVWRDSLDPAEQKTLKRFFE